jgi:methionyl aminopeptidase
MPDKTKLESILDALAAATRPGITTLQLNEMAEALLRLYGVEPAFKGYKPANFGGAEGYPAAVCVSIDNEVIHGIPNGRVVEEGQVVKIDIGTKSKVECDCLEACGCDFWEYDDGATTVLVGKCSSAARRLVKATKEALEAGLQQAKAGNTTHDIARAVSEVAKRHDVHVVHGYGGHGIGVQLHMEPHIPNEVEGDPVALAAGMRIAIEPMFATNHGRTYVAPDGWTVKLQNGGLAAHFEKTVSIL